MFQSATVLHFAVSERIDERRCQYLLNAVSPRLLSARNQVHASYGFIIQISLRQKRQALHHSRRFFNYLSFSLCAERYVRMFGNGQSVDKSSFRQILRIFCCFCATFYLVNEGCAAILKSKPLSKILYVMIPFGFAYFRIFD